MTTVLGNVPNSNTKLYLRKESCCGQVRPIDAWVFENIEDRCVCGKPKRKLKKLKFIIVT